MDRLNEIAHLSVLRDVLNDLDPAGDWQHEPLYQKWRKNRYSLTQGEFHHLSHCLDTYRKRAEFERIKQERIA
ncbi:hypothetical protein AB3R30_21740 [Leptolyngbyaceae cyanobacterium UHCC 1019]